MNNISITQKSVRVAIIGSPNTGKSSILNAIVGKKNSIVSPTPHTTRNAVMGACNISNTQIVFIDTPGFIREGSSPWAGQFIDETVQALEHVDLILLVIDASNPKRFGTDKLLQKFAKQPNLLVTLNKVDTRMRSKLYPIAQQIKDSGYEGEVFLTSARTFCGIETLKNAIANYAVDREWEYIDNEETVLPKEIYAAECVREKAFYCLKDELPFNLITKPTSWDFREDHEWRAEVSLIVPKDSHKGIVIGARGSCIKKIGVTARTELESIWGKGQLFLKVCADKGE